MFKKTCITVTISLAWAITARAQSANSSTSNFETIDRHKSNLVRVDPAANWGGYQKYVIAPASYEPSNPAHTLKPAQLDKLRAAVDSSLRKALPETADSGSRVLEVRPVITDARRANPYINALSFAAIQAPISYGGASLRLELVDAASGTLIGEISSTRCAGPWNIYPWQMLQAFEPVGHASTMLKRDARMLRKDLERLARMPQAPPAPAQSAGGF
jgi:hypothetical protein